MTKIAITSDLHVAFWSEFAIGDDRLLDCVSVLDDILAYCLEHGITGLLIGGDLFHKPGVVQTKAYNLVVEALAKYRKHKVSVYCIHGNHDQADKAGQTHAVEALHRAGLVHGFTRGGWKTWVHEDLVIQGFPYCDSRDAFQRRIEAAHKDKTTGPRIAVFHHGFKGARVGTHLEYQVREPLSAKRLLRGTLYKSIFCVDDLTEALTPDRGWVRQSDLAIGDKIAVMTADGRFLWRRIKKMNRFPDFVGKMVRVGGVGGAVDHFSTEDHSLWIRTKQALSQSRGIRNRKRTVGGVWRKVLASNLPKCFYMRVAAATWVGRFSWRGPIVGSAEDLAEFVGWYVSEGHCAYNQVTIAKSAKVWPGEYEHIAALINRLGFRPSRHELMLRILSRKTADWVGDTFGRGGHRKCLPRWVKNWPKPLLEHLLRTMIRGDGHEINEGLTTYCTTSPKLADDVQEMAIKLGWGCTLSSRQRQRRRRIYELTIVRRDERFAPNSRHRTVKEYEGLVWCPTVSTGLWIARRNGRVAVTGNSGHYHAHQPILGKRNAFYIGSPLEHTRSSRDCISQKGFLVYDAATNDFELVPLERPRFLELGQEELDGGELESLKGHFVDVAWTEYAGGREQLEKDLREAGARAWKLIEKKERKYEAKDSMDPAAPPAEAVREFLQERRKDILRKKLKPKKVLRLALELLQEAGEEDE